MSSRIPPILALLVAIGIFFGYVNPTWTGEIAATKIAIENYDLALASASEYSAQQNELASARNAIDQSNLTRLSTLLPDSVDNVELILDLNALAARSGLSLSNVDVRSAPEQPKNTGIVPVSKGDPVSSVDLSLTAVGTYPALQAFLTGVEKSARLLDIREIFVKGSDTGVYNYQMTVRLYWLR